MLTNLTLEIGCQWQHAVELPLLPTIKSLSVVQDVEKWQPDMYTLLARLVSLESFRLQLDGWYILFPFELPSMKLLIKWLELNTICVPSQDRYPFWACTSVCLTPCLCS